ncbi:MAG: hypothetical protein HC927_11280 [Deltaproteobacteria bacterium]|nr:hypothetical protein [Deltaproteobacteria bacterium]
MLIAAERSGDLDSAFELLAADMASEVDTRSARLLALLEPAVIVGLALVIGPIIVSLVLAMLTLRTGG